MIDNHSHANRIEIAKERMKRIVDHLLYVIEIHANKALIVKPVMLPPGRAMLVIRPEPTGSITLTNTIGTVRIACCNCNTAGVVLARTTSGPSAISSAAYLR